MKRGTSLLLVVTLIASVIAGALSVSFNFASASYDSGYITIDYIKDQISGCTVASSLQSKVDSVYNNIETWCSSDRYFLTYIEKYDDPTSFYISVFRPFTNNDYFYLSKSDSHYGEVTTPNSFIYRDAVLYVYDGSVVSCNTTAYYSNEYEWLPDSVIDWSSHDFGYYQVTAFGPGQNNNDKVFISMDLYYGAARDVLGWQENIFLDAPVFPFYLKAFNLGERKYITISDQSIMRDIDPEKEDYILVLSNDPDQDYDVLDWRNVTWDDVTLIPGGENFVSGLTNVSPLGVYAYDITDLWWTVIENAYLQYADSIYGVALNTPYDFNSVAPDPGTNGTPDSYTEIYNNIYNYTTNYPTDPVVPQDLAYQLSGGRAISSGLGYVNPPLQIKQWLGVLSLTQNTSWEYDLSRTGLDPDEMSMLNFDILSVAIVPARGQLFDRFCLQYWDYTLEYNSTDDTVPSQRISYCAYTDDLFEMYDLVIFCNTKADFLGDTWVPSAAAEKGLFGYTGDMTTADLLDGELSYWILTKSAIQKSQLFVFCDGFNKMYDLVSQYANKMDLWDNSFFSWSMSIFHELETLGGHLSHIDSLLSNLHLDQKLDDIIAGLYRIAENTDETQDPVWYVSLWNWVRDFTPSDDAFITGLTALDDGLNNIPALPAPTGSPGYPLLPTFTPTPSPDPGGV